MLHYLFTAITFLLFFFQTIAQINIKESERFNVDGIDVKELKSTWTWRTPNIIPKNEIHIGITSPIRFGLDNRTELESHIFLSYFIPNIGIKKRWDNNNSSLNHWSFASRHVFYYPTTALNYLKNSGFKNFILESEKIPEIFALKNEFIISYNLNPDCKIYEVEKIITARIGIDAAKQFGENSLNKLTFYTLYHRSSIAHKQVLPYFGLQFDSNFYSKVRQFNFTAAFDLFSIDFQNELALESLFQAHYLLNGKTVLSFGVLTHLSSNEIEKDINFIPHIDIMIILNQKKLNSKLFLK